MREREVPQMRTRRKSHRMLWVLLEHGSLKVEASAADDALHILDTLDAFDIREH